MMATFSGTEAQDLVEVIFEDGRPATIVINGESFDNPDPTLEISLLGSAAANGNELTSPDQILFTGADFDIDLSLNQGTVNDGAVTFSFIGSLTLYTGDGNDTIEEDGSFIENWFTTIDTRGGDDTFIHNGSGHLLPFFGVALGTFSVTLGDGDDHYITNEPPFNLPRAGARVGFDGGDGHDIWESRWVDTPLELGTHANFERLIAPDPGLSIGGLTNSFVNPEIISGLIEDNTAVISYRGIFGTVDELFEDIQFENFNFFDSTEPSAGGSSELASFVVNSSTNNITIRGAESVRLSELSGDTSQIEGQIFVDNTRLLVVNGTSETNDRNIFVTQQSVPEVPEGTNLILGLTPRVLFVRDTQNTVLEGGQGADNFFVSATDEGSLFLNGHGGEINRYIFGARQGGGRSLSSILGTVVVNGGDGFDHVRVDDDGSNVNRHFRLRENWVHTAGSSPVQDFKGINFNGVDRVDVNINNLTDRVFVSPSTENRFIVSGGRPGLGFTNVYRLVPPYTGPKFLVNPGNGTFTYVFTSGAHEFIFVSYPS